jgi:hypothetical protein
MSQNRNRWEVADPRTLRWRTWCREAYGRILMLFGIARAAAVLKAFNDLDRVSAKCFGTLKVALSCLDARLLLSI